MNTRDVLSQLAAMGVHATTVRRTGEIRVPLPGTARTVTVSAPSRRKDAPRALLIALKRWQAESPSLPRMA